LFIFFNNSIINYQWLHDNKIGFILLFIIIILCIIRYRLRVNRKKHKTNYLKKQNQEITQIESYIEPQIESYIEPQIESYIEERPNKQQREYTNNQYTDNINKQQPEQHTTLIKNIKPKIYSYNNYLKEHSKEFIEHENLQNNYLQNEYYDFLPETKVREPQQLSSKMNQNSFAYKPDSF